MYRLFVLNFNGIFTTLKLPGSTVVGCVAINNPSKKMDNLKATHLRLLAKVLLIKFSDGLWALTPRINLGEERILDFRFGIDSTDKSRGGYHQEIRLSGFNTNFQAFIQH
ncbi:MAG: hypothetical protein EAZ28_16110 [Oscillatoriales cyanobacterium]|nr:MAG: hypothetical protein EAZ28_16110 [Oscillatoriales cyanobacterium]